MVEILKSIPSFFQYIIISIILLIFIAVAVAIVYKIFVAEKIKIGKIEIDDIDNQETVDKK